MIGDIEQRPVKGKKISHVVILGSYMPGKEEQLPRTSGGTSLVCSRKRKDISTSRACGRSRKSGRKYSQRDN